MAVQTQYLEYVLEQLAALGSLRAHRMFGGIGLYTHELFFGLIDDDTLFFKTGESNIEDFRSRKMPKFMPFPDKPDVILGYHQVPADIIEDAEQLVEWARKSVAIALAAQAKKAQRRKPKAKANAGRNAKATPKVKAKSKGKSKSKATKPLRNQRATKKPAKPKTKARRR